MDGCRQVLSTVGMAEGQHFQLGKSKVFVKAPESLFLLEEARDRKFHAYAKIIQRCFRRWANVKHYVERRRQAQAIVFGKKERRRMSMAREYRGDYLNVAENVILRSMIGKKERVLFSDRVTKYDRRFKPAQWDLVLTNQSLTLVGWEKNEKKGKIINEPLPAGG